MTMHYKTVGISALVVGMSLSPLACQGSSQAGSGGEEQAEADGDGDGDGGDELPTGDGDPSTGDGDPTTGDGDGEPLCDVSQFPTLEPLWLDVRAEGPLGLPFFEGLAMSDDALFVSVSHTQFDGTSNDHYLAGHSLNGAEMWTLEAPGPVPRMGTDGIHVYYEDGAVVGTLRRVAVDGTQDASWAIPVPDELADGQLAVAVEQPTFILYGQDVAEVGDPPYTDAFVALYTKDGDLIDTSWFGEAGQDDSAFRAVEKPGGGFYVMFYHVKPGGLANTVEGVGLQDPTYSVDLGIHGAMALLYFEDGLIVGGVHDGSAWTRKLGPTGIELWERKIEPCGEANIRGIHLVKSNDRIWGTVRVDDGSTQGDTLLIELDLDGQLLGAFRVGGWVATAQINGLVANDEAVVVSGIAPNAPGGPVSYLARLQ